MLAAVVAYTVSRYFSSDSSEVAATNAEPGTPAFVIPAKSPRSSDGAAGPASSLGWSLSDSNLPRAHDGGYQQSSSSSRRSISTVTDCGTDSLCPNSKASSGSSTPRSSDSGAISQQHWRSGRSGDALSRFGEESRASGGEDVGCDGEDGSEAGCCPHEEAPTSTLRSMVSTLSAKLSVALQLLGDRDVMLAELRSDLSLLRSLYRQDVAALTRQLAAAEAAALGAALGGSEGADGGAGRGASATTSLHEMQSLLAHMQA